METIQRKNCVLDKEAIRRKIRRMALQIAEHNIEEQELIIAGVTGNGEVVAKALQKELQAMANFQIQFITILLDKKNPLEVSINPSIRTENKAVLVVDDVANSGRTLLFAIKPFLNTLPKKIQTVVLVERSHKTFPVHSDFVGLSVSTTLQEHIIVQVQGESIEGAFLE